mmetsp:Transcript_8882/g.11742  ORF Transcript_8882/g.11742 Transcript_8882/m.11742 type:complete len:297 (-) Transcript_8882:220-1110(-)
MKLSQITAKYGEISLVGKQALVVGGTGGIGKGIALRLARANVSVTIVGRNEARGREVVTEMSTISTSKDSTFDFIRSDVQLLSNVNECVQSFKNKHSKLDFLVLTQGIATTQGRTETEEGIDQKLSLHYFSRMAFVDYLLPLLEESQSARVLSVLSGGVHSPYVQYRDDPELKKNYSIKNAADVAGFYNDLGLDSFSTENPNIVFVHSAPGFVNSDWGRQMPFYLRFPIRILQPLFGKSIHKCAEFMCEAMFNPDLQGGFHLRSPDAEETQTTKLHEEARDFVWKLTKEILNRHKS